MAILTHQQLLAHDQGLVSSQFARKGREEGAGIGWSRSAAGNPLITGSLMRVDCELWSEHDAGDHLIVLGQVVALSPEGWHSGARLLLFKGS